MKIRRLTGIIIVALLALHIAAGGLAGSQSQESEQNIIIQKTISSLEMQTSLAPVVQSEEGRSIFSKTTIISLLMAVMGIVAFRRNTYS